MNEFSEVIRLVFSVSFNISGLHLTIGNIFWIFIAVFILAKVMRGGDD